MRKNLSHFLLFLVLLMVSYSHYKFASTDTRNLLDFHEQLYGTPILLHTQVLEGQHRQIDVPLYAKIIGGILSFFGKSYFVLRMSYLLFFLFYLLAFYLAVLVLTELPLVALLSVIIHLSIPMVISYSRMSWPHMYAASFTLAGILFLIRFFVNKKGKYINVFFFLLFQYFAVETYYTSIVYVGLICLWLLYFNYKKIYEKKFLTIGIILIFSNVIFFVADEVVVLKDKFFSSICFTFFDFDTYRFLFFNRVHLLFFSLFLFVSLMYLYFMHNKILKRNLFLSMAFVNVCFTLHKSIKKNMFLFVLFFSFTIVSAFLTFPIHVTILGLVSACAIVAFFIGNIRYEKLRFFLVSFVFVFFILFSFFPKTIMSYSNIKDKHLYKTAIYSDNRNWGREDLEKWIKSLNLENEKIAVFGQWFYPGVGTNYMHFMDLNLMSEDNIVSGITCAPEDLTDKYDINFVNNLTIVLISDIKINEDKFKRKLIGDEITYVIFEDIKELHYWLFLEDRAGVYFDFFKNLVENFSKGNYSFDYDELIAKFGEVVNTDIWEYLFQSEYIKTYFKLRDFLRDDVFFEEVKRIECSVKDIVIYRISKNKMRRGDV